jgi:hypothetical protein
MRFPRPSLLPELVAIAAVAFAAVVVPAHAAGRPDLVAQRVASPPARVNPGMRLTTFVLVANVGGASPGRSSVARVFLSTDRKAGHDVQVGGGPLGKLPPRVIDNLPFRWLVPKVLGKRYVVVCLDATRKVAEASERNNCAVAKGSVTIVPPPPMPVITTPSPTHPVNALDLRLEGTASVGTIVEAYTNATCSGQAVVSGSTSAAGRFSMPVGAEDGVTRTYHVQSSLFGGLGAKSPCSTTSYTVTGDFRAPASPTALAVDPASPNTDPTASFVGSAEPGSTVSVYLGRAQTCTTFLANVTAGADGRFRYDDPYVMTFNGEERIYVATATDAAGNVSNCSTTEAVYDFMSTP